MKLNGMLTGRLLVELNRVRESPISVLLLLAAIGEAIYLGYFVRTFPLLKYYQTDIDMGGITGHSTSGYWTFVSAFALLFVLMVGGWWTVHGRTSRQLLWLVLAAGTVFGVTMSFVYPVTAIDIFTYVDQSRIMLHYHQNPVFVPPAAFPADPWMQLADGWKTVSAPYGPIGIVLDALPMMLAGANLLLNLIFLKLMFTATTLANGYLAYRITRQFKPEAAVGSAVLVTWNPVVLFEVSANGHNDGAMMLVALLGLLFLVEGGLVTGTVLVATSALVKYATAILLPLVILHAVFRYDDWKSRMQYFLTSLAASLAVTIVAYLPFWRGVDTFSRALLENQLRVESFSSVVLDQLGMSMAPSTATLIGRLLFLPLYVYALWLARGRFVDLLRGCFLALFGFLGFAVTNFKIWYATWPSMLAAVTGRTPERLAAVFFGFGATISAAFYGYLWVWKGISQPGSFPFVNNLAYVVTFLPAAIALGAWKPESPTANESGTETEPESAQPAVSQKR